MARQTDSTLNSIHASRIRSPRTSNPNGRSPRRSVVCVREQPIAFPLVPVAVRHPDLVLTHRTTNRCVVFGEASTDLARAHLRLIERGLILNLSAEMEGPQSEIPNRALAKQEIESTPGGRNFAQSLFDLTGASPNRSS
jgi:hypothetical protein